MDRERGQTKRTFFFLNKRGGIKMEERGSGSLGEGCKENRHADRGDRWSSASENEG